MFATFACRNRIVHIDGGQTPAILLCCRLVIAIWGYELKVNGFKIRRLKAGFKQWELARAVGMQQSKLSRFENGQIDLDKSIKNKLDRALTRATHRSVAARDTHGHS